MIVELEKLKKLRSEIRKTSFFVPINKKKLDRRLILAVMKRIDKEGTNQVFSGGELRKSREWPLLS